jgi:hypothetical protein
MSHILTILGVAIMSATAQTKVDLRNQARGVDFSAASYTKPARTGAALSATCSTGEAFVLMSAAPGSNFFICTATNTWTLQGSASVAPPGGDLSGSLADAKSGGDSEPRGVDDGAGGRSGG